MSSASEKRLVLVRHGITDWNREGRFQGHLDPPLSEDGRHEAALVATRLVSDPALKPRRIISSSLARALQTATAIGEASGVSVEPDTRLIELGQGRWEGRTHAELQVSDAHRYSAWRAAIGLRRPPGGETAASALARLDSLVSDLTAASGREWPVCLVTHGGAMRLLARVVFDLRIPRAWALDVDNASVSVALRLHDSWRLERWNDTGHLLGREPTHVAEAEGRPLAL